MGRKLLHPLWPGGSSLEMSEPHYRPPLIQLALGLLLMEASKPANLELTVSAATLFLLPFPCTTPGLK